MTADQFAAILDDRIDKIRETLAAKAGEYASDKDRLHNFKRAAAEFPGPDCSDPAAALVGMMRKHWVSVADLVARHCAGGKQKEKVIDEKIGDAINYLILLEAVLKE